MPLTQSDIAAWITAHLAAKVGCAVDAIDVYAPFANYGLASVDALALVGELEAWLGRSLSPTLLYDYTTINALAAHLAAPQATAAPEPDHAANGPAAMPIAIVGMACRFPGAPNLSAYWELLCAGRDAIQHVPSDRWDPEALTDASEALHTRWGGFLEQVDQFDPKFFRIAPREAHRMDPQQRLLLEVAWEAIEDAGIHPQDLAQTATGVFVGISTHDYSTRQGLHHLDDAYFGTGNALSIAANRLSYVLNLNGPSVAVDTACSSSLVALHLACQSLRSGEATQALVGGVNVILDPKVTINFSKAGFMAPDGRCKAFDARADGYVRGEGAGLIVLKPLAQAQTDGDRIYALLRGSAINQDGHTNGLTAPSQRAQEAVLRAAYANADVAPHTVDYIETHGTGTALGDRIEAHALGTVLQNDRSPDTPCPIGSVKTNIGHLEAAAGVASLIKTALALHHAALPASLHFDTPNPLIDFDDLNLRVQAEQAAWPQRETPRRAGVSAFGFGGTNAHAVLEEAPAITPQSSLAPPYILPLSGHTPEALHDATTSYANFLAETKASFSNICYTASARRMHHPHRLAVVATDAETARHALTAYRGNQTHPSLITSAHQTDGVVFVFSGQGTQWVQMGCTLWETESVFREALETCDDVLSQYVTWSIFEVLEAGTNQTRLHDTDIAQPVLCAFQIALATLLRSWSITPDAVVGHSIGELAAAHLAGVFDLDTTLRLAVTRGRLMQTTSDQGGMLAIALPHGTLAAQLNSSLSIAAINGPNTTIVSGPPADLADLTEQLAATHVGVQRLESRYAFHSAQMEPLQTAFAQALGDLRPKPATVPFYSTLMGSQSEDTLLGTAYWQQQLRETVCFAPAVEALLADGFRTFIEIGPHPVLQTHLRAISQTAGRETLIIPTGHRTQGERSTLLKTAAHLYAAGHTINWSAIQPHGAVVSLPPYAWQRQRYWVDDVPLVPTPAAAGIAKPHTFTGQAVHAPEIADAYLWETTISLATHPYLHDHQLEDTCVFPAAGYLTLVQAAAQQVYATTPTCFEDIVFAKPLILEEGKSATLQVHLGTSTTDSLAFRVVNVATPHEPLVTGTLYLDVEQQPSHEPQPLQTTETQPSASFYEALAQRGLTYGPGFQQIEQLATTTTGATAYLKTQTRAAQTLWPPLLDSCFQAIGASVDAGTTTGAFVPHRLHRLTLFAPSAIGVAVHARSTPASNGDRPARQGNAVLVDADNTPILQVEGLVLHALQAPASSEDHGLLYTLHWQEKPLAPTQLRPQQGLWLIFGADDARTAELQAGLSHQERTCWFIGQGDTFVRDKARFRVRPDQTADLEEVFQAVQASELPCKGIVFLWTQPTTTSNGSEQDIIVTASEPLVWLTTMLQALLQRGWRDAPRLWVVTQHAITVGATPLAPSQSLVWGFCRSLRHEHPELRCTTIDVSDALGTSSQSLSSEMLSDAREDQIVWRGDTRFVARLLPMPAQEAPEHLTEMPVDTPLRLSRPASGRFDQLNWKPYTRDSISPYAVEIYVEASGLNFRDVLKTLHQYPDPHGASDWLGDECAGTVVNVGNAVTSVAAGDAVLTIAPHSFSRYVTVQERQVLKKPETLSFAQAASLPVAYLTAYYALDYLARLRPGERVLIHAAAGGVGQAAIRWAQHVGATIFATAGNETKRAWLKAQGITHVLDSRSTRFAQTIYEATDGEGVDVVLGALTDAIFTESLTLLRPHGRFLDIGKQTASRNMPVLEGNRAFFSIDLESLTRDRPDLVRSLLGEISLHIEKRHLSPLPVETFSVRDAEQAFRHMAQAKHMGKIALLWDVDTLPALVTVETSLFRDDATYLITGGLGALGLATAHWMVEQGARHLALVSRRLPRPEVQEALASLRETDATILTFACDVSDATAVENLFVTINDELPALRGIIHTAGVLEDGAIVRLEAEQIERVLAPKVDGAWHLHTHSQHYPLDFFILYSSAAAWVGSPGQAAYAAANAFLDALAHYRHQRNLPATSMLWGPWDQMGFAATSEKPVHAALRGLERLTADQAFGALAQALRRHEPSILTLPLNMRHWQQIYPQAAAWPVFEELADTSAITRRIQQAREAVHAQLATLATDVERLTWIEAQLRHHMAQVLQWPADEIETDTSLNDLGFDSLMAIELRNRLETHFGIFLPATFVWNGPAHVADLVQHIAHDLGILTASPEPVPLVASTETREAGAEQERRAEVEQLSDEDVEALLLAKLADIEDQYDA